MSSAKCEVCGSEDFTRQSGYYICNNCDTQSQDIQEQSFEYFANGQQAVVAEEKEEIVSKQEKTDVRLTSFECYNLILKGLIEELIDLGADPNLKVVAFQLWAKYLKRGRIAFFSKTKEKYPNLPAGFRNKDVEILYQVRNLRKKLFPDIRNWRKHRPPKKQKVVDVESDFDDSVSSSCTSVSSFGVMRRKHALSKLKKDSLANESLNASSDSKSTFLLNESDVSKSESLQSFDEERKRKTKNQVLISLKANAKEALKKLGNRIKQIKLNHPNGEIPKNQKKSLKFQLMDVHKTNLKDVHVPMNMCTVFSVLRVALLLMEDSIQLSDLLRWWCEGHISMNKPERFVSVDQLTTPLLECILSTRAGFQIDIKNFVSFIELRDIPTPNLHKLIERYCVDLCLPNDFIKFIHGLVTVFTPHMDHAFYYNRVFPDYECRAMAFVLCAFKLLFSLDDVTELRQSEFASAINKRCEETGIKDIPTLFSWTSWVRYIECRKTVLCKFDIALNQLNQEEISADKNVVLKYWGRIKSERRQPKIGEKINSVLIGQIESTVRNLQDGCVKPQTMNIVDFPASLTPMKCNTQLLLTDYFNLIPEASRRILSENVTDYSVKYILNQEWTDSVAERLNIEIERIDKIADTIEIVSYQSPVSNLPAISKSNTIPAYVDISVRIEDDERKYTKVRRNKLPKSREFHPESVTFDSIPDEQNAQAKPLRLFRPSSQYWFFHDCGRCTSYEQFNTISEENFSDSFLWLLRECASVLRIDRKDLYMELVLVESVLCCLYDDDSYAQKTPIVLFPNEW